MQDHFSGYAFIRCDGSPEIGLGHVVRCLAVAEALREVHRWQVTFLMRQGSLGIDEVCSQGFVVHSPTKEGEAVDPNWFLRLISRMTGDVLICDVRDELRKEALLDLQKQGLLIALIDDLSERRIAADMVFYPPIPQVQRLDWRDYRGRVFTGWEWIVLRRDVRTAVRTGRLGFPKIVITMGGSDPSGFTIKAVQAMKYVRKEVEVMVVAGPGFCHAQELSECMAGLDRTIDLKSHISDLPQLIAQADLVVGAFGTTAYELAVLGVPGVVLCATEDHAESAQAWMNAGFGISLGLGSDVSVRELAEIIDKEIARHGNRSGTNFQSPPGGILDGRGAERVAEKLVSAVKERQSYHDAMAVS